VSEQSPKRLLEVRQRLYELLTKCIPADIIMKVNGFYIDEIIFDIVLPLI